MSFSSKYALLSRIGFCREYALIDSDFDSDKPYFTQIFSDIWVKIHLGGASEEPPYTLVGVTSATLPPCWDCDVFNI